MSPPKAILTASHDRVMVPIHAEAQRLPLPAGGYLAYHRRNLAANDRTADGINTRAAPPGIIFLGGFASDMTGTKAMALDAYCAATGRAFVRFDYRGHGQSSGSFTDGTIGAWRDDALAVVDRLTEGPQILVGSSMGGWLMLLCALARPDRIHALVGLAAAPDFTEELMWQTLDGAMQQRLMAEGRIEEPSAYSDSPYVITRALIEDGRRHLLLGGAIHIDRPVRLLHGQADEDVPYSVSLRLADRLVSRDVVVSLIKDGDHRLSRNQDIERLMLAIEDVS
ncbi:alpha/beta hydrolase [Dongia rigui]|uniref:Alpha/beta hydrolase n=1 Tax=Dongia rigui TaxID=940149 RepID=A0ABU5DXQ5_9PROT|nr:alpha/beta hydrolase [Dongia rigui]MDY0872099.1 alpha/beta hydrolase [Dongia rigui]